MSAVVEALDVVEHIELVPHRVSNKLSNGALSDDRRGSLLLSPKRQFANVANRTKAALPDFEKDHIQITSLMNELIETGKRKRNEDLVRLATRIAAQSLNDIEVAQPTTILIGDYLRQRLSRP